jgi:hypothetical protein
MRRLFFVLCALVIGAAPALAGRVERPPTQYHGDATVTVHFVADVQAACESWGIDVGVLGCASPIRNAIIVPISCGYRGEFADLVCHEVAHLLGWRHRAPLMLRVGPKLKNETEKSPQ